MGEIKEGGIVRNIGDANHHIRSRNIWTVCEKGRGVQMYRLFFWGAQKGFFFVFLSRVSLETLKKESSFIDCQGVLLPLSSPFFQRQKKGGWMNTKIPFSNNFFFPADPWSAKKNKLLFLDLGRLLFPRTLVNGNRSINVGSQAAF